MPIPVRAVYAKGHDMSCRSGVIDISHENGPCSTVCGMAQARRWSAAATLSDPADTGPFFMPGLITLSDSVSLRGKMTSEMA